MHPGKHPHKLILYVFRQQENSLDFLKAGCMIPLLLSKKCHLFHNVIFLCSSNIVSTNHVLKFKYQPPIG
jgi:hypothetical protein